MRKYKPPLVSVVTLSYNRRDYLLELINSLRYQDYPNFELIMVDNDSQDGSVNAVEESYSDVKILRCPRNYGMVAYNFGFASCRGKYVLVIDDDGLPASSEWISQVVQRFELNPRLGAVACTIRMQHTGRIAFDSPQFAPDGNAEAGFSAAAYNGTGAGLRTSALREVGYYPFPFFRSWLELHLCTRLLDSGWDVRCFPSIEVWHRRPSGLVNRPLTYFGVRNYLWYAWTFYPYPQMLIETMHFLGSHLRSIIRRQLSVDTFIRALFDGLVAWPRLSSHRQPISYEILEYLRHVRRCGNENGLIPRHRAYPIN